MHTVIIFNMNKMKKASIENVLSQFYTTVILNLSF